MSDKPTYLGLLNKIALGERGGYCLFTEWAAATSDPEVRQVLLTVAAREGEHSASFIKRINELGYELEDKTDPELAKKLDIVRSDCSDKEKVEALGFNRTARPGEPDFFDGIFTDHTIDIGTGALLGRYISEERDSGRLLRGCYGALCDAADAQAAVGSSNRADTRAARATAKQLTALDGKVDSLTRAIDELRQIVCAQSLAVN